MIIQCDSCQTRFKLAEDKLKPEGVRIRCTSCSRIFSVLPPEKQTETPTISSSEPSSGVTGAEEPPKDQLSIDSSETSFSELSLDLGLDDLDKLDQKPLPGANTSSPVINEPVIDEPVIDEPVIDEPAIDEPDAEGSQDDDFDFDTFNMEDLEEQTEDQPPTEPEPAVEEPADFLFEETEDKPETDARKTEEQIEDLDLDNLDLDDLPDALDEDFSFDPEVEIGGDLGATFEAEETAGELPALDESFLPNEEKEENEQTDEEEPGDEFSFDSADEDPSFSFSEDTEAIEFDLGNTSNDTTETDSSAFEFEDPADQEEGPEPDLNPFSDNSETGPEEGDDSFAFDESDFDTGPALETDTPEPEPELERPSPPPASPDPTPPVQRTPPPAKPRKRSGSGGRKSGLILIFLLAVLGGGFGYLGWSENSYDPLVLFERLQKRYFGEQVNPDLQLTLGNLNSHYVANQTSGRLFAIQGTVSNNYYEARSAISVKGTVFDATGKALVQQVVFCGNPLDQAALATLPWVRIEERMNNQFGDSLSNLNLLPGEKVPFTIVMKNLPDKVAEFDVVIADSRPGTK